MNDSWIQIITVVFANLTAIWWFRKECREDWKMCKREIKEMKEEFKQFRQMWAAESKDFHERLLKIEMDRK